jgi:hypothetical protein
MLWLAEQTTDMTTGDTKKRNSLTASGSRPSQFSAHSVYFDHISNEHADNCECTLHALLFYLLFLFAIEQSFPFIRVLHLSLLNETHAPH